MENRGSKLIEPAKKFELGLSTSYGAGLFNRSSGSPGVGIFFGYKLSPRSTLELKLDYRRHGFAGFRDYYSEIALSYKSCLALGRKLSPYLQVGVGYVRSNSTSIANEVGWTETEHTYAKRGGLTLQVGGGYHYSLLRNVGLDFGLHLHNLDVPSIGKGKFLVGRVGVNVAF